MALGDFRGNNAAGNFCQWALSTAEATKCRGEAEERKKKARARDLLARLLLFDNEYPAGASEDKRGECDKRGAEMISNKRRTLFIQVRIDL